MLSVVITAISYLVIPIIIICLKREITYKNRSKIFAIYCGFICFVYQIIGYYTFDNYRINFSSGFFYYFILMVISSAIPIKETNESKEIKIKKINNNVNNTLKPKKIYYVILIISLILNVVFISSLAISINKYNVKNNKMNEFEKCINEIKFHENIELLDKIWDPSEGGWKGDFSTTYYLYDNEFKSLEKCYDLLNIKVNYSKSKIAYEVDEFGNIIKYNK